MKDERGLTLMEVVIALAILGIIAAALMGGLAGAFNAFFVADEHTTAESLARSQMESIKSEDYSDNGTYGTISFPPDYSVTFLAQPWDAINHTVSANVTGIQRITVTVGHNTKPAVITLEDYKARRY